MRNYTFRTVTRNDYPLLRTWLGLPHVRAWWGDAEHEISLIEKDLGNQEVDMRIVELAGRPFAYVQDYNAHLEQEPQYGDLLPNARAIDTFLGDLMYQGQGHGSDYLTARARQLRETYPMVAVDPNMTNTRAITAFTKAGFRKRRLAETKTNKLVQVMTYL